MPGTPPTNSALVLPHAFGKVWVYTNTGSAGAWEQLGWYRDRGDFRTEGYFDELKCDDHGGDAGPPADIQFLGERVDLRLELSKWDEMARMDLAARVNGGTAGAPAASRGTLLFAGTAKVFEVVLWSYNGGSPWIRYFKRVVPRGVQVVNPGTRWSICELVLECHEDANGILYLVTAPVGFNAPEA